MHWPDAEEQDMKTKLIALHSHPAVVVLGMATWAVSTWVFPVSSLRAVGMLLLLAFVIASFLKRRAGRGLRSTGQSGRPGGLKALLASALRGLALVLLLVAFLAAWIVLPWQL